MSLRVWIIVIGIELAAPASGQGDNQSAQSGNSGQSVADDRGDALLSVPIRIVEPDAERDARERREEEARRRESRDLAAQEGMNAATPAMNDVMQGMAACEKWPAPIVALLLIRQSVETRKAVTVTCEIGQAQVRACLSVSVPSCPPLRDIGAERPIPFEITIENKGSSPARNVRPLAGSMMSNAVLATPCPDLISPRSARAYGIAIASGESAYAIVNNEMPYHAVYDAKHGNGERGAYLAGIIFYEDVFGDRHEHRVSFDVKLVMDGTDITDHWAAESANLALVRDPVHIDEKTERKIQHLPTSKFGRP